MPKLPSAIEACRLDLFTAEDELREKYPPALADRIMRLRDMYNYWLSNPSMKDRQLRDAIMSRYEVSQATAYSDIVVIHQIVPLCSQKSRDFHRARTNEMLLETYNMAKARKDTRTMERAATAYGKLNRVDLEDEMELPLDTLLPQPFVASTDVTLLGIPAIPDVYNHISRLTRELSRDIVDMEDVSYEEVDLEEQHLFAPQNDDTGKSES